MKVTPKKIAKAVRYLYRNGWQGFVDRVQEHLETEAAPYDPWYRKHCAGEAQLRKQRIESEASPFRPLVSICVPLYRTPKQYLYDMLDSVYAQSYGNWQLCLADGSADDEVEKLIRAYPKSDKRLVYQRLGENRGIAGNTNAAFALAEGEWIGLLDHDDMLAPDALYEVMQAAGRGADVIYTDEDKISADGKEYSQPHFKPDYSPDLLRSNNYITHFFVVRQGIVAQVGGFRSEFDGAQDYDFIFRCTDASPAVTHIPKVLYHWRITESSTAQAAENKQYAFEAGKRAIEAHLSAHGIDAEVRETAHMGFYRVKYALTKKPLVSILIPNKDERESLKKCLDSIEKSTYTNYEIIIIENNSTQPETFAYYESLKEKERIRVITYDGGFCYSAINNLGAKAAKGEYLLLLNNDVEVITEDWIEELLGSCQRKEVGAVGAKLYYPDDTVQHAGVVVGMGGVAGNLFVGMRRSRDGYLHKASIQLDYSAVTAACMMVRKSVYEETGGFTEELAVAFNDVDFCLKLRRLGYLIVYQPWAQLYHYESKSRGSEDTKEKQERFEKEVAYMKENWHEILQNGDPYYNPNLSLVKTDYSRKP